MEFSRWWVNEFKTIKFPSQGTIFDYYIDPDTKKFLPWTDKVPAFELDPDVPLQVHPPPPPHGVAAAEVGRGGEEGWTLTRRLAPPLQASLVHTMETARIRYFMDLLMEKSWPVMLVGNAGTGKSVLMSDKLDSLSTDDYLVQAVPFNFYTTSAMLQGALVGPSHRGGHLGGGQDPPQHPPRACLPS